MEVGHQRADVAQCTRLAQHVDVRRDRGAPILAVAQIDRGLTSQRQRGQPTSRPKGALFVVI